MPIFLTPDAQPATLADLQAAPGTWGVVAVTDRAARAAADACAWQATELHGEGSLAVATRRLGSAHLVLARWEA